MLKGDGAAEFMAVVQACIADQVNPLIDLEQYLPIIWSAARCLDNDVDRILEMNGITKDRSMTPGQARRIALVARSLRAWRGTFRAMRSVVGALTGGPVIIVPWVLQRVVVDESTWTITIMSIDEFSDTTQVFLLGQGPESAYDELQVDSYVDDLARTALDSTEYISCFALTAWRDGVAGWRATGDVELVASSVLNEYESVDIGPDVGSTSTQHRLSSPTRSDSLCSRQLLTVWFKTIGAAAGSTWKIAIYSDRNAPITAYTLTIMVGNGTISICRTDSGVDTVIGTKAATIEDGDGDWYRVDLLATRKTGSVALRAYVDGDPSGWFYDTSMLTPGGQYVEVISDNSTFPTGRIRIAAITGAQ